MNYLCYYKSPLGVLAMSSDGSFLTGLRFEDQTCNCDAEKCACDNRELEIFRIAINWLNRYFAGIDPGIFPALYPEGSAFRKAVWDILMTIPWGSTMTYGEIAKIIAVQQGCPRMSAQAVGGAVAHNPIAIMIPCHRVIGAGGRLTGYAGGLERKTQLLRIEGILTDEN